MSLIEIMVTMVIVAMLFGPIFLLIQGSHRRALRGGDETIATIYATDIIELVRGGPFDAFCKDGTEEKDLDLKTVFGRSNFFRGYDAAKYDARFDIRVDVSPAEKLDPTKIKLVRVRVSWMDKVTKRVNSRKIVTYYTAGTL